MAGYLRKYVGQYRVKADYDLDTNDYPRDHLGNIDTSFDDYYICCKNNIKIRHCTGSILSCYIPSKTRAGNIIKTIYQDKIGEVPDLSKDKYLESLCNSLVQNNILINAEILDYEGYFEFKSNMVDYISNLVGVKVNGANISPLSSKNLPKQKYKIPDSDLKEYQDAIKKFPTKIITIRDKQREMIDGLVIKSLNNDFDKIIQKVKGKNFNVNEDRKLRKLKGKDYIHSIGMWNEYINFIKERKI